MNTATTRRPRDMRLLGITANQHASTRTAVVGHQKKLIQHELDRLDREGEDGVFYHVVATTGIDPEEIARTWPRA